MLDGKLWLHKLWKRSLITSLPLSKTFILPVFAFHMKYQNNSFIRANLQKKTMLQADFEGLSLKNSSLFTMVKSKTFQFCLLHRHFFNDDFWENVTSGHKKVKKCRFCFSEKKKSILYTLFGYTVQKYGCTCVCYTTY